MNCFYRAVAAMLFVFCYLSLSHFLPDDSISEEENRVLAERPIIFSHYQWNYKFGRDMEDYLRDHFPYRQKIIKAQFKSIYTINGRIENDISFATEEGWMFNLSETVRTPSLGYRMWQLHRMADIIKRLYHELSLRGKILYVILLPAREDLYRDIWVNYWKGRYTPAQKADYNRELIKDLQQEPGIRIIYPESEVLEAMSETEIYTRRGIHLTEQASRIINNAIYQRLKADFFPGRDVEFDMVLETQPTDYIAKTLGLIAKDGNNPGKFQVRKVKPTIVYQQIEYDSYDNMYEYGKAFPAVIDASAHLVGFCYMANNWFPFFKYLFRETKHYRLVGSAYSSGAAYVKQRERLRYMVEDPEDSVIFLGLDVGDNRIYDYLKDTLEEL